MVMVSLQHFRECAVRLARITVRYTALYAHATRWSEIVTLILVLSKYSASFIQFIEQQTNVVPRIIQIWPPRYRANVSFVRRVVGVRLPTRSKLFERTTHVVPRSSR